MDVDTLHRILVYWLPLATVLSLLVRTYYSVKNRIFTWANSLLNNHLAHLQQSAESMSSSLQTMNVTSSNLIGIMENMREDFRKGYEEHVKIHSAMLTNLEIIKELSRKRE